MTSEITIPDGPVPIRAWRIWGLARTEEGFQLQSSAAGFVTGMPRWPERARFDARCLAASPCSSMVPNPRHACGIYALSDRAATLEWAGSIARVRPVVIGEVDLWGIVVQTAKGWRAQHAYPASFETIVQGRRRDLDHDTILRSLRSGYLAPAQAWVA